MNHQEFKLLIPSAGEEKTFPSLCYFIMESKSIRLFFGETFSPSDNLRHAGIVKSFNVHKPGTFRKGRKKVRRHQKVLQYR